jgi:hypothetical protein
MAFKLECGTNRNGAAELPHALLGAMPATLLLLDGTGLGACSAIVPGIATAASSG